MPPAPKVMKGAGSKKHISNPDVAPFCFIMCVCLAGVCGQCGAKYANHGRPATSITYKGGSFFF